jgi:threonine/homoserine/homoserine lactone efflux protein
MQPTAQLFVSLASILGALAVGVVSPGPSFLMIARISVARSRRDGLAASVGMGIGGVIFALLALLGMRTLILAVPTVYLALRIAGAIYLIFLGIRIWRRATTVIADTAVTRTQGPLHGSFARGLLTQLSNPKTAVVYGSIFAALLPANLPKLGVLLLPCLVFVIETGWYAVVAYALSSSSPRNVYLRAKTTLDRVAGSVMGLFGVKLLVASAQR